MRTWKYYRFGLMLAVPALALATIVLGYGRSISLDWLNRIPPEAGVELVIVTIAVALIVLTLLIGLGGGKADRRQPVGDLPKTLARWTPVQPVSEWADEPGSSGAAPSTFLTRSSSVQGRQLSAYLGFYNLRESPFSIFPEPRYLLLTERHLAAIPILNVGQPLGHRFVTLVGDAGCGKTTLLRRLRWAIDSRTVAGFIPGVTAGSQNMYEWVGQAFRIARSDATKLSPKEHVKAFVNAQAALGKSVLLLVDEAQALAPGMLLALYELVHSPDLHGKLRVVLAGSPGIRALFQDEKVNIFKKAENIIYDIPTLSYLDMNNYINKRLSIAGATRDIFSEAAKETIFYFSLGRPGLINMLCDLGLAYGATDRMDTISSQTILDIVEDRNRSGLTPFRRLPGAREA